MTRLDLSRLGMVLCCSRCAKFFRASDGPEGWCVACSLAPYCGKRCRDAHASQHTPVCTLFCTLKRVYDAYIPYRHESPIDTVFYLRIAFSGHVSSEIATARIDERLRTFLDSQEKADDDKTDAIDKGQKRAGARAKKPRRRNKRKNK